MNSIERETIEEISDRLLQLLQGKVPEYLTLKTHIDGLNRLVELVNEIIDAYSEIHEFILPLSRGVLSLEPPKSRNLLASPFKELHSQLQTLNWQVQQIAKGDYAQRVTFMGDFSVAFNNLVDSLAEKDRLVKEQINILEQEAVRLRESETRYSLALEYSPGGIYIFDPISNKVLEYNIQFKNILGYDEADLAKMSFCDFYADSSLAKVDLENIVNKSFYTIKSRQLRKKSGEIIEADIQTYWSVGTISSVIIVNILDVTKEKEAVQVLNKYRILLEEAKDIIIFTDSEGRITETNKAAEIAYGYTNEELRNMTIYDCFVYPHKEIVDKKNQEAYFQGVVYEAVNLRRDKSTFPVEVSSKGSVVGNKKVLVNIIRDISDRKRVENELHYLATHDPLTRIPNRYVLEEAIGNLISKKNKGILLLIDVDNFKLINDTYGHAVGDKLLVNLVAIVKEKLDKECMMARIAGDEFALLLPQMNIKDAKEFAEDLRVKVPGKINSLSEFASVNIFSISIGITSIDYQVSDVNEVMVQANFALYQAKEQGGNRIVCITCEKKGREKLKETNKIIHLVTDNTIEERFMLHFQPVLDIGSGAITHHEGLLRLIDVPSGIIPPGKFIPVAERFGLMNKIDRHVIKLAFDSLHKYPDLQLFVNISGASLGDESLFAYIKEQLLTSGVEPSRIGFEITETAAVKDLPRADRWIKGLKKLGCTFALDDFGIGFSTFSYLQYLPVDYVKIDGSYVRDLDRNDKHKALVQAINTVAVSLGKTTIAEFVENGSILEILKELNVKYAQGYFIGKPEPIPISKLNLSIT